MKHPFRTLAAALALAAAPLLAAAQPVPIVGLVELSGGGATVGTNFDNARQAGGQGDQRRRRARRTQDRVHVVRYADQSEHRQGAGGQGRRLGRLRGDGTGVLRLDHRDRWARRAGPRSPTSSPAKPRRSRSKAIPMCSGRSFTQAAAMPKVATYIKDTVKAKSVAVIFVNNDFGKGGRDVIVPEFEEAGHRGRRRHLDRPGPARLFRRPVLKAKQSNADALFVYLHEEESARLLRELRKQGYDKPIVGETTIVNEKVHRARRRCRQRRRRARRADGRCAESDDAGVRARSSRPNTSTGPITTR